MVTVKHMCRWHRFLTRLARHDAPWRIGIVYAAAECRRCERG